MIKIAPSILSADFGRLGEQLRMVEEAGAHMIHVDVMDGHFVPNLTYGPLIVKTCKSITSLPLDVHLMIANAEERLDAYLDAGADYVSIHVEAVKHLQRALAYIREAGARAGVALNPATSLDTIRWITEDLDFILVMSVNPGFEAQTFLPNSLERISTVREMLTRHGAPTEIEVDGGVGPQNTKELVEAGATLLVAGSAIFKSPDPATTIQEMKAAADAALK